MSSFDPDVFKRMIVAQVERVDSRLESAKRNALPRADLISQLTAESNVLRSVIQAMMQATKG